MRILQLSGSTPRPWAAELTPRLNVLRDLPDDVEAPLRAAIEAVVRAQISASELEGDGLSGTVVVDGEELTLADLAQHRPGLTASAPLTHDDLTQPSQALAAGRTRALDAQVAAASETLAEAEADLTRTRQEWAAAQAERADRLATGWRTRAEAAAALRQARRRAADETEAAALAERPDPPARTVDEVPRLSTERVEAARAAHVAAGEARAEAQTILDEVRARSGPGPDLADVRKELDVIERELASRPPTPAPSEEERRGLADRRAQIAAELESVVIVPIGRVTATLAAAEQHGGIAAVEAAQVAVEWERVRDLVAEGGAAPPADAVPAPAPAPHLSADTAARVRAAQDQVVAARRGVTEATSSAGLDPDAVEALEAAHAEVLEAWEGSERRIGVGKARRRLEDAQQAEREILGRLGFASYTEFMMSGRGVGMASTLDLDHARRNLADAEAAMAEVEAEAETERSAPAPPTEPTWDAEAARGRLTATLEALRARAAELLGEDPGDDVAGRLRERIATDPVSDLRLALDEVGLPLGEVLSSEEVLSRARTWLAQQDEVARRRSALTADRVEVEDFLARLDAAAGARSARDALVHKRDDLRARVAQQVASVGTVEAAKARLARDAADLERAAADLADAEAAVVASAAPDEAVEPGPPTVTEPGGAVAGGREAEARDAQTALDMAVFRLLPGRDGADDEADDALGRAEARVELARLDLASLEQVQSSLTGPEEGSSIDVDSVIWALLTRFATHQRSAAVDGPGPTPLVLDEPFGPLASDDVVRVCQALLGPARSVQTVLMSSRPEVAAWVGDVPDDAATLARVDLLEAVTTV